LCKGLSNSPLFAAKTRKKSAKPKKSARMKIRTMQLRKSKEKINLRLSYNS
jgi:hypothetical protein